MLFVAMVVLSLPLLSFKNYYAKKVQIVKTEGTEFGEFTYDGQDYAVYGNSATNTVTEVYFYNDGYATGLVYNFTNASYTPPKGTAVPAHFSATIYPTSTSGSFNYSGELLFY